ncbi:MAG: hypothetical protein NT140_12025 [Deltaproteobacteria bacterium]|nr:hypothetical protein [Deltaproteobacteria bacterium]
MLFDVSFEQLPMHPHKEQYGKLGLVFDNEYLSKNKIRKVYYYKEESLFYDPIVLQWNHYFAYKSNLSPIEILRKKELEEQILAYRKPHTLFNSFSESRKLAVNNNGVRIADVYERYPIGYEFCKENEWRISSQSNEDYLNFEEKDLKAVITSDEKSTKQLERYFATEWNVSPDILVFP